MIPYCILIIEDDDDREFMTQLYLNYHRLMRQQISMFVHDEWAVEDLMQTTLEKLIDKVQDLRGKDRDHLVNYIIAACRNRAQNYIRDRSRHPQIPIDDYLDHADAGIGGTELESQIILAEDLHHLSKIWLKLDNRSRYLLESYYILETPTHEIADHLGIKPGSVRMALTRARQTAYELLEEYRQE